MTAAEINAIADAVAAKLVAMGFTVSSASQAVCGEPSLQQHFQEWDAINDARRQKRLERKAQREAAGL